MSLANRFVRQCGRKKYSNIHSKGSLGVLASNVIQGQHQTRRMSMSSDEPHSLISTEIAENGKVAILKMNRPPVNSLSLEMCTAISKTIKELESDSKIQGMVLASSSPSTFSAGLDLTELYQGKNRSESNNENPPQRLVDFWTSFQQLYLDLYGSRLATVAAIQGHAPAAGCMLALACDYRMMQMSETSRSKIGLNETQFGIAAPPFLGRLMLRTIGQVRGEQALALGTLFDASQALEVGLVDRVVNIDGAGSNEKFLDEAKQTANKWAMMPPPARVASKMLARKEFLDELIEGREEDLNHFCTFILQDVIQAGLGAYLASLKKK